jgi:HK97 family phage major capsid protein
LNPVRQVAKTFTIATKEWKGVSSDGVTVAYVPEATEATDASPTLAQPVIMAQQWRAFVPFSIELGQDWSGITDELGRLISDGRDVVDATQFLTGNGYQRPGRSPRHRHHGRSDDLSAGANRRRGDSRH